MNDAGFSLVEALVAMALLAVAATGLLQATARHLDAVAAIESRAAAGWSAENALTEARLGLPAMSGTILGRRWQVGITGSASPDPGVVALTVSTRSDGVAGVLRGFAAKPPKAELAAPPKAAEVRDEPTQPVGSTGKSGALTPGAALPAMVAPR